MHFCTESTDKTKNLTNFLGYHIVEWIGVPWSDQETCQLMCDAVYWNSIPRAPFWQKHNSPLHIETHTLIHVITADLPLLAIAENDLLPNGCANASSAKRKVANKKLAIESHDFLSAEIFRREALEDVDSADTIQICSGVSSSSSSCDSE